VLIRSVGAASRRSWSSSVTRRSFRVLRESSCFAKVNRIDSRGGPARYRTHGVSPRDSSGEKAMFVFHAPYLTLPQVFGWILERDTERVGQVPENMTISILHLQHVDRHLNAACTVITAPDVDLSKLANIEPNDAPPKDSKLRNYLTQYQVGPDQLPKLKPKSLASFGAALLDYLGGWYATAGSSPDEAETLASRDLHELDDWLAAKGVRACLFEQAHRRIHNLATGNAAANKAWDDALSEILVALANRRIVATGRRNGMGDPELVPADNWPLLSFSDRELKGRGTVTCAYLKADRRPSESFWTDLRFKAEDVLEVWPPTSGTRLPGGAVADDEVNAAIPKPVTEKSAQRLTRQYLDQEKHAGREPTMIGLEKSVRAVGMRGGRHFLRNAFHELRTAAGKQVRRGRLPNSPK
jgi:hypothetical protein